MMNSNKSTEEMQQAIEQFCSRTGLAKSRAEATLEACDWNVDKAVSMHLDGNDPCGTSGEAIPVTDSSTTTPSTTGTSSTKTNDNSGTITGNSITRNSCLAKLIDSSTGVPSSTPSTTSTIGSSSSVPPASTSLLNDDYTERSSTNPTPRQVTSGDGLSTNGLLSNTQAVFQGLRKLRAETRWLEEGDSATSSGNINQNNKRRTLEDLFRPPLDLMLRGSMEQSGDLYEDTGVPGPKRTISSSSSQTSEGSSPAISASPPRFMALEEIMKAANEVYNMCLAHEIAMDKEFKLEKTETPANSLHKRVDDMMRKVFWELLQNELDESPSNYKRALMLLGEIKENLMSFLLPQHTRLKQEIEEILDLDLVKQQAENGALDFQRYAHYILSVMARLCAPIRDEKIRQLTQTREVVPLFRGIMELLDEMRLDMANFLVQQIRPQILQQSVTYERKKFTEFLESQAKMGKTDGLEYTKKWLKRIYEEHDFSDENTKEIINKVLTSAYGQLLVWDDSSLEMFPETLLLDEKRIISLRDFLTLNIYVGSALLVTVATFPMVQSRSELKELIRDHLLVIMNEKDDQTKKTTSISSSSSSSSASATQSFSTSAFSDLETRLENAALQIIADLKNHAENHTFPEIDSAKEISLKAQIVDLKNEKNRIRQIVQRRILEFVESVFTSNTASPVQMPKGLTTLQKSLSSIAGQFMRIASHNRAVYGAYYANIITDLVNKKL